MVVREGSVMVVDEKGEVVVEEWGVELEEVE